MTPVPADIPRPPRHPVAEVAALFLRLGFTAFGGPAAHVALIEEEVVNRRRWLDRQHFLDLVSAVNFIPGPNSTELAIHLGYLRAGFPGLIVAGLCFIVPAMLIVLPLAWCYVTFSRLPQFGGALVGVKACMLAIVAVALYRFTLTGIRDRFNGVIATLAAIAAFAMQYYRVPQAELIILAAAAFAGILRAARRRCPPDTTFESSPDPASPAVPTPPTQPRSLPLITFPLATTALGAAGFWAQIGTMALFFLKVGATLFGSGYVLATFLHAGVVEQFRWMTEPQLVDAIAVGQVTPGPLLTTATFIGYFVGARNFGGGVPGGIIGGVVATLAIFLPSFVFVAILGPVLPRLRKSPLARAALDAMNAAVVALIAFVTIVLARSILFAHPAIAPDWLSLAFFAASLTMLLATRLNPTWIILAAGLLGALARITLAW